MGKQIFTTRSWPLGENLKAKSNWHSVVLCRDIQATLGLVALLLISRQNALSSIPKIPKRAQYLRTDTLKDRYLESFPSPIYGEDEANIH